MVTNTIFQATPFGFNKIELGTLIIYTGKVRIKGIKYVPDRAYINVRYNGPYCFISFEVIDRDLALDLYQTLGRLCKSVAQARLDQKWGWINA